MALGNHLCGNVEVALSLAEERGQRQSNLASHRDSTSNYSGRMVIVIEHVRTKKVSFIMKAKPEGGRNISVK